MTIEIVGKDMSLAKKITCRHCGSILSYMPADVQRILVLDISGCSELKQFIVCPCCGKEVLVWGK